MVRFEVVGKLATVVTDDDSALREGMGMKRKSVRREKVPSASVQVLIRWPSELLTVVDAAAARAGVDRSQFVRSAALRAAREQLARPAF